MRTVVLIGLRGSGKSSVARELAALTGRAVLDLDAAVEARAGKPVARVFAEDGEPRFRDLEGEVLRDALARSGAVLATGGGVVVREANREAIRRSGALVVWLRARPETLAERVTRDAASIRPALAPGGPLAEARALLEKREPWYRELAALVLDTDERDPASLAREIAALLGPTS